MQAIDLGSRCDVERRFLLRLWRAVSTGIWIPHSLFEHLVQESWLVWSVDNEEVGWLRPLDARVILQQIDPYVAVFSVHWPENRPTTGIRGLYPRFRPMAKPGVRGVGCSVPKIHQHHHIRPPGFVDEAVEQAEVSRADRVKILSPSSDAGLSDAITTDGPCLGRSLTIARTLANRP